MLKPKRNNYMKYPVSLAFALSFFVSACSRTEANANLASDTSAVSAPLRGQSPSAASAVSSPSAPSGSVASNDAHHIKVYKDPNCGCCKAWIQHLEQNGFVVEVMDMPDLSAVKTKYGVKQEIQACHTGVVNGYAIEGHVPADVILKML